MFIKRHKVLNVWIQIFTKFNKIYDDVNKDNHAIFIMDDDQIP